MNNKSYAKVGKGGGKGGGKSPKAPSAPPPPPTDNSAEVNEAARKERLLLSKAQGRASTILTREIQEGAPETASAKLLGS